MLPVPRSCSSLFLILTPTNSRKTHEDGDYKCPKQNIFPFQGRKKEKEKRQVKNWKADKARGS